MNHHLGNQWVVMVQCQDNRPSRGCPAVSCKYKTSSVIVNYSPASNTLGPRPRHWPVHRTGVLLECYILVTQTHVGVRMRAYGHGRTQMHTRMWCKLGVGDKNEHNKKIEVAEMKMLRWMCGVTWTRSETRRSEEARTWERFQRRSKNAGCDATGMWWEEMRST